MLNFILDGILMWEEGGTQWSNGPMAGHIIVRMGRPSMEWGGGGGGVMVSYVGLSCVKLIWSV